MPFADPKKIEERLFTARRDAEEREAQHRAVELKLPYMDLRLVAPQIEALALVPEENAREQKCVPAEIHNKDVVIAAYNPATDGVRQIVDDLKNRGYSPVVFVCSFSGLASAWEAYARVPKKFSKITGEVSLEEEALKKLRQQFKKGSDVQKAIADFSDPQISKMFELILAGALALGASDIHIEAAEEFSRLRYRMDGELNDMGHLPLKAHTTLAYRIKLLSKLKLNVSSRSQDGRFTIKTDQKDIEIRTSVIPSAFGETIVMRILDPDAIHVGIEKLGLRPEDLDMVLTTLQRPNGMLLNTGPTGSGKTTTLYTFLQYKHSPETKIITVEDPIEYHLEGITQTQVNAEAGYTFASGLRAILRQDPDIILIGEIRDFDTAETALNAALTGHVVFSTLHTNDAAGAIPRLIDMGVKPQIMGPAMNLVIAQRLVRKLCPHCKKPVSLDEKLKNDIARFLKTIPKRVQSAAVEKTQLHTVNTTGCAECQNGMPFGYRGRVGVFELFVVDETFEPLLQESVSAAELKKEAMARGMLTLQQDGILKALEGITSLDEVVAVTGPLKWGSE